MAKLSVVCVLSGLVGLLVVGCSDGGATLVQSPATKADLNGDGAVTCAEWSSWLTANHAHFDADKSGAWSEAELNRFGAATDLFTRVTLSDIDVDGDGQFSLQEVSAYSQTGFTRLDGDGDCTLSRDEMLVRVEKPRVRAARSTPSSSGGSVQRRGSFSN